MSKVIVVGGGAAGMYAALTAASYGHEAVILEKNEKLGKKLFITGKGRCNVTNASDMDTIFANVVSNGKFLYSAFHGHTNRDFMEVLEGLGLELKVERGERVFPVSDKSSDVIKTLSNGLVQYGVDIRLNTEVTELIYDELTECERGCHKEQKHYISQNTENRRCCGVRVRIGSGNQNNRAENSRRDKSDKEYGNLQTLYADAVILATGGLSYPSTGSTGDGLRFARKTGIEVTPCQPALVPLNIREQHICAGMMGLSLKNVTLTVLDKNKKEIYHGFGEMLFTHFGISGPLVLSASSYIRQNIDSDISIYIDLKPALSKEQLQTRVTREFEAGKNKEIKNVIPALYPGKLVPMMLQVCKIDGNRKIHSITKEERQLLCDTTKKFPLTFAGLRGYNEAIITQGGIHVKEINPSTMESRKVKGLYFAGEMIDVDALTGGYNLQIAWSTAYAAGSHIPFETGLAKSRRV